MEFVEKFNEESNDEFDKKELVVNTIYKLLDETTDLTKVELDFVKFMLNGIIESMILTSTKEIKLKLTKKKRLFKRTMSINEIIEDLHTKCLIIIKQNQYDTENILINIPVMVEGYEFSRTFKNLNELKESSYIKVIKRLLTVSIPKIIEITDKDNEKIQIIIKILPDLVDILIEISNKKYVINQSKKCLNKSLK